MCACLGGRRSTKAPPSPPSSKLLIKKLGMGRKKEERGEMRRSCLGDAGEALMFQPRQEPAMKKPAKRFCCKSTARVHLHHPTIRPPSADQHQYPSRLPRYSPTFPRPHSKTFRKPHQGAEVLIPAHLQQGESQSEILTSWKYFSGVQRDNG